MSTTDDIVSDFIVNTCRLNTQPNINRFIAWVGNIKYDNNTTTGSVSELYIEPMLQCIGDIDLMHYNTSWLAVPSPQQIPQRLPQTFDNNVRVLDIVNSPLPGYAYL